MLYDPYQQRLRYPKANAMNLFGWVEVEYVRDQYGNVVDPQVLENCAERMTSPRNQVCVDRPNPVFDQAALDYILGLKYPPGDGSITQRKKIIFEQPR